MLSLHKLSIKNLLIRVMLVVFALVLVTTASVLVTGNMTHAVLTRHMQAMAESDAGATGNMSDAEAATHHELEQSITLATGLTLGMIASAFFIGLALAVMVYRRVAGIVAATEEFSDRIERGDFAARFTTDLGGEAGALATAFNRVVEHLKAAADSEAEALRRMNFIVESSPVVIYTARISGDYGFTYISLNIRRQLGHAPSDFLGDSSFWANNLHPNDREWVLAHQEHPFTAGRIEAEYRIRHKDGSWRWMRDETLLVCDATGEPCELVGTWSDITERKILEQSIERRDAILNAVAYGSARFLRAGEEVSVTQWNLAVGAVLAHLGEATGVSRIWIVENTLTSAGDLLGRLTQRWNVPEFAVADDEPLLAGSFSYRQMGVSVEALRLRRGEVLQVRRSDMPGPVRAAFERLEIRAQLIVPITVRDEWWGSMTFDDCSDERLWPEIEMEALRAAANLFGATIAARAGREALRASLESLGSMVEKMKRQSAEIERQNAKLAQANRMKTEFLAAISHELKTPLNGILGFADLLVTGLAGELAQKQREYAGEILGAGGRLLGLVNRLLELAQIAAGEKPFMPGETDVGALLNGAAAAREEEAKARGIAIAVVADDTPVNLDARLIHRLLDELLDNAIKFNHDGGTVTLRATVRPGKELTIEVSDSGIGISSADQARLFEPFVQIDAALNRRYGGTGLGLALAKRIAQMHGGDIAVDSTPGQGSRFTVRLPWESVSHKG